MHEIKDKDKDEEIELVVAAPAAAKAPDRFLPISIIIAAVLISGAVVFATVYGKGGVTNGNGAGGAAAPSAAAVANSNTDAPAAANAPSTDNGGGISSSTLASLMVLTPQDAVLGSSTAPVTLIEYGDYQCPFCGEFYTDTQSQIVTNYVNTGKVKMVFRNFPFLDREPGLPPTENESHTAAAAALCAQDQNEFWPYHDALYAAKWGDHQNGEDDGFFTNTLFIALAQKLNMNISEFTQCIESGKYTNTVNQEAAAASQAGIDSTPTFILNGTEISGAQPYSFFQAAIEAALSGNK